VIDPRHPELERAVADAVDDPEAWAVYGDWLAGQGDPRGEIIALELDGQNASSLYDARAWLGGEVSAPLEWRHGFVASAQLHSDDQAIEGLLASPAGRFLRELRVDGDAGPVAAALIRHPPRSLRELTIGRTFVRQSHPLGDLAPIWPLLPHLRRLELHGLGAALGDLDAVALGELELQVEVGELERALVAARLPALTRLRLYLPELGDGAVGQLARSFAADSLRGVRELGLIHCARFTAVLRAFLDSPLAAHVERLDVGVGRMGFREARLLVRQRDRLPRLCQVEAGDLDAGTEAVLRDAGW
jgi:uncharacterized protein (TIGR02996 family)